MADPNKGEGVFISYSRADSAIVSAIRDYLEEHRIPVWQDERIKVGQDWAAAISNAIRDCAVVVICCSAVAMESSNVAEELGTARRQKKTLLPLMLEPSLELRDIFDLALSRLNWLEIHNATNWRPKLLEALAAYGVVTSGPPDPILQDTAEWLESLRALPTTMAEETDEERGKHVVGTIGYLSGDLSLTRMRATLSALARNEQPPTDKVAELRRFQRALVDVTKLILLAKREDAVKSLPVPPYDQWLPFKRGKPSEREKR